MDRCTHRYAWIPCSAQRLQHLFHHRGRRQRTRSRVAAASPQRPPRQILSRWHSGSSPGALNPTRSRPIGAVSSLRRSSTTIRALLQHTVTNMVRRRAHLPALHACRRRAHDRVLAYLCPACVRCRAQAASTAAVVVVTTSTLGTGAFVLPAPPPAEWRPVPRRHRRRLIHAPVPLSPPPPRGRCCHVDAPPPICPPPPVVLPLGAAGPVISSSPPTPRGRGGLGVAASRVGAGWIGAGASRRARRGRRRAARMTVRTC